MTNTGDVQSIGGRQFQIVERGLDEKQVEEFINELLNRLKTAEESAETKGVTAVAEAKRLVEMLGEEAQQIRADAKAEASRIISEAESASSEESEAARKIVKATGEEARKVMEKAQARADSLERAVRHQANHVVESVQRQVQTRIKESLGKASQNIMDEFGRLSSEVDLLSSKVANRSPIDAEKHEGNADRPPLLSNGSPKLQPDPRREIERNVQEKPETVEKAAEQTKVNVRKWLLEAQNAKIEAHKYLQKKRAEANEQVIKMLEQAKALAKEEADQIKAKALAEANKIKGDMAVLQAALKEELEAQRLLTKVAEIRASYPASLGRRIAS